MATRVLCCGTFDYLHPGHLSFLKQAKQLGDQLFVVIATDVNVKRIKGIYPDQDQEKRKAALEVVEFVDDVRLGYSGSNFLLVVHDIQPDVIALGYDQKAPSGLEQEFPDCQIIQLEPFHPDRFKSSFFRKNFNSEES